MTKRAIIPLFLVPILACSMFAVVEAQIDNVYAVNLQGPTWDHSAISVLIVPRYAEEWWNPSYLDSTLRALNQWNEAISLFASNQYDFANVSEVNLTPRVSNFTSNGFDAYITWIGRFGNETCEAGLTRTTYSSSNVIINSSITFSAYDCRGNTLSEVDMQNVALHELGHCLGLSHANFTGDLMYFAYTLSSPVRAISTLDMYGVSTVFRWLDHSQEFNPDNQGAPIYSVTLPSSIEYEYLPISEQNLPPQSTIDQIRTFLEDFTRLITQPEVLVLVLLALSAITAYAIIARVRRRRTVSQPV